MLIQFSVENYRSIKDKIYLYLGVDNESEHPENIISKENCKAISSVIIYGANASGKSSIFKAIDTAVKMIRNSNEMQVTSKLPVSPFKFNKDSVKAPTSFEFTFIAHDGLKYIYGFSATEDRITEEYLYCYRSAKPSLVFDRNVGQDPEYKFSRTSAAKMNSAVKMNTPNKLFLPTATSWNVQETKEALEWLTESIDCFYEAGAFASSSLQKYRTDPDQSFRRFTNSLLKQADINISDILITRDSPFVFNQLSFNGGNSGEIQINTEHVIKKEDGTSGSVFLTLQEESEGTQQLIFISPLLKDTFDRGKLLIIDEIDNSLHPFIVKYIINLFRNPSINKKGAQLIVTTHETTLLSLDIFRRDQIYFTEKDADTGITDLYSLDEFSVRKDENVQKGYLLGRYGAIPYLKTEEVF